jgi:hypothetical protein
MPLGAPIRLASLRLGICCPPSPRAWAGGRCRTGQRIRAQSRSTSRARAIPPRTCGRSGSPRTLSSSAGYLPTRSSTTPTWPQSAHGRPAGPSPRTTDSSASSSGPIPSTPRSLMHSEPRLQTRLGPASRETSIEPARARNTSSKKCRRRSTRRCESGQGWASRIRRAGCNTLRPSWGGEQLRSCKYWLTQQEVPSHKRRLF